MDIAPDVEYESVPLSQCVGKKLIVNATEFKKLGKRDGVVMSLANKIDVNGETWEKIHSSTDRIVDKMRHEKVQNLLSNGDNVSFKVISGVNQNGTWVDIE